MFIDRTRHDVYDVCVGSLLGFVVAYFSYRRYYPQLQSPRCHEPYKSRQETFNQGFGKLKDVDDVDAESEGEGEGEGEV